ncbi:MAG: hypothetical protein E6K04_01330 [Methanobacteriota archaeon]|nr:MAG: hypothetical protein E6K04_01330 [Euryarchaeota archaeon]
MNLERVRSVLGVWAPMTIGLFIIVTSLSFYFTATLTGNVLSGDLEPWRLICSAGAFFVGGLLIFSTYGRYTKTKERRRKGSPEASHPAPAPSRDEEPDYEGDPDHEKD